MNNLNNIDEIFRNTLSGLKEEPSSGLWDKLSGNLDKIQIGGNTGSTSSSTGGTGSINPSAGKLISFAGKTWMYYAAAAVSGVALVASITYFANKNDKSSEKNISVNPTENVIKPQDNTIKLDDSNSNIKSNGVNYNNNNNFNQSSNVNTIDAPLVINDKSQQIVTDNKDDDQPIKPIYNNNLPVKNNLIETPPIENKDKIADNKTNSNKVINKDSKEESDDNLNNESEVNNSYISKVIEEKDQFKLLIPNSFSPNGDGVNDIFIIPDLNLVDNPRFTVYNKAGKILYDKINYQNDWNGDNLPDGVYYYSLTYKHQNNPYSKVGMIYMSR